MKRALITSMMIVLAIGAIGAPMWPSAALRNQAADARPEAVATGGALLILASILRRNRAGRVK